MDNLFTVLCYIVSCGAGIAAFYTTAKSAERVCLARWDVAEKQVKIMKMADELDELTKVLSLTRGELARVKSDNEKLRQLPQIKPRF